MPRHMSVFCSQECFKAAWAEHKGMHKATAASYMYAISSGRARSATMPNFAWTGPLRPHRHVLTRLRLCVASESAAAVSVTVAELVLLGAQLQVASLGAQLQVIRHMLYRQFRALRVSCVRA